MGALLALLSALLSTSKDVVSKRIAAAVDGTVSSFASFLYAIPFYLGAILISWLAGLETFSVTSSLFTWILLRSLSDACAETCKMHALARGELSVVSSLIALHPVFMLGLSPIITGDPITGTILLGVGITVAGNLVLMYQPEVPVRRDAVLLGLATAFFFTLNNCFDRLSVQSASPLLSGFLMTLLAGILLLPAVARISGAREMLLEHRAPLLLRGVFEVAFMVSKLSALTFLQAPEVSAILRLSLVFSVIGGRVIFQELHFWRKLFGSLLTVLGVAVILRGHF